MIPEYVKNRIELRFGKAIRYPKDCEALALSITNQCREKISPSTLMRIFGLTKGATTPRLFTLDLIARYIGYNCWDAAINEEHLNDNSLAGSTNTITIGNLAQGQILTVQYGADRIVTLRYNGDCMFNVVESTKSTLQKNDLAKILRLELGYPLVCETVIRNGKDLGTFIGGHDETGIRKLTIV